MKAFIFFAASLFVLGAVASEGPAARDLNITSFVYTDNDINNRDTTAELCGTVSGNVSTVDRVTVTSDPTTSGPASYTTMLDEEGKFCVVIRTVSGRASAKIWGIGLNKVNEPTLAEVGTKRP